MDWTDDKINQLKQLWTEGLTTAAIGTQLKISKNAVAGKVHRLNLKRRPPSTRPQPQKVNKKTPAAAFSLANIPARSCRWPSGDPQHANFRLCGQTAIDGRPYCAAHCRVAYIGFGDKG